MGTGLLWGAVAELSAACQPCRLGGAEWRCWEKGCAVFPPSRILGTLSWVHEQVLSLDPELGWDTREVPQVLSRSLKLGLPLQVPCCLWPVVSTGSKRLSSTGNNWWGTGPYILCLSPLSHLGKIHGSTWVSCTCSRLSEYSYSIRQQSSLVIVYPQKAKLGPKRTHYSVLSDLALNLSSILYGLDQCI